MQRPLVDPMGAPRETQRARAFWKGVVIFLTVGHQSPFDRLVRAIDEWASQQPELELFGQIGDGLYEPKAFPFKRWLSADCYDEILCSSASVVSHAGTGTIVQGLMKRKPLLVLPRSAALNETRNDHQVGTARYFSEKQLVLSIDSEAELASAIPHLESWRPAAAIAEHASAELVARISTFLNGTSIE
jgi:UDP-N-acetylglucosamine transferase subunit ALG13